MSRVGTAFRSGATELRRTPLLLVLLVVAPAYVIYVFTAVAPEGTAVVHVGGESIRTTLRTAFPAFTAPMTAALLSGITGLFVMGSTAAADARLVVAGYRARQVVLARIGLLAGVAVVATAVSVGVTLTAFEPASVAWFAVGTSLAALAYGMVGALVGVLLDRLAGVYLVLFGSMVDLFVFQNPMATDTPAAARLLPGHYPLQVATRGGFTGGVELAPLGLAVAYLGALGVVAAVAFYREMHPS